ncbi:MAG: hypothetical protein ACHQDF_05380 [Chitinophagales bacterium]
MSVRSGKQSDLCEKETLPGDRYIPVIKWTVYALAALYFINCFTPLRIHYDMLRYFSIKDCIEIGCPPTADPNDYLPFGYTALLLGLSKLGILRSFSIVFINGLYLLGGLYFVRKVFSYLHSAPFFLVLVLLNWTVIKFFTHPLSELQYLFFSMASVYAFYTYTQNKKIIQLLMAFGFAGLAFLTRTVGIALVAALCLGLIWEYRKQLSSLIRKNKILVAVILLCMAGILLFSKQLGLNHYTGVMSRQFKGGVYFSEMLGWHFREWGEISLNISVAKVIGLLPAAPVIGLLIAFGILMVAGFLFICFIKKNRTPFIVKAYLFCYMFLMFNWPFSDPRFWVPVIPLIAAVIAQTAFNGNKWLKMPLIFLFIVYATFGILSVGYMTYTSLNKKVFAKTQAAGVYRNEYETHFFGRPLSDTATRIDPFVMSVLERYGGKK